MEEQPGIVQMDSFYQQKFFQYRASFLLLLDFENGCVEMVQHSICHKERHRKSQDLSTKFMETFEAFGKTMTDLQPSQSWCQRRRLKVLIFSAGGTKSPVSLIFLVDRKINNVVTWGTRVSSNDNSETLASSSFCLK
jgi:hypothetical protein